ncbi:hypothetical protein [Thalassoroseus pseudoceratinae]|uniref:hypothetical protein n=1 Tax=Thalassoroseus pseudoceratinae TaxID=2713176 RepID=UPI0014205233|nr:hypothetical protein [Thalassoroseus pseudoceratinae]
MDRSLLRAAQVALNCHSDEKPFALAAVIEELVIANELGLAYQLCRCVETQGVPIPGVSSRLIRPLIFGRIVQNADGPLGAQLREDLQYLAKQWDSERRGGLDSPEELFLRAATLTPALILGDSEVTQLLRSFPMNESLPQLSNLCIRVSTACRRLGGKSKSAFATSLSQTQWDDAWNQLQTEISEWIEHELDDRFTYRTAKPIFLQNHWTVTPSTVTRRPEIADEWAFWQHGLTWLTNQLKPLLNGEPLRRRNQVARLLQTLRENSSVTRATADGNRKQRFQEFQRLQQAAIVLAERWIQLVDSHPATNQFLPQEASDLQKDIKRRFLFVDQECQDFIACQSNRRLVAAVRCCQRSVLALWSRVVNSSQQSKQEPRQELLLAADLLRIPHIVLDDHWTPLATPERLERKLLETVTNGLPDWGSALVMHRTLGNPKAARRIESILNAGSDNTNCSDHELTSSVTMQNEAADVRPIPQEAEPIATQHGLASEDSAWIWDFEESESM